VGEEQVEAADDLFLDGLDARDTEKAPVKAAS